MTKAKILRKHLGNVLPSFEGTVILDIGNAMDEWATQQCAQQWTTVKPDFKEECVLVTATKIRDHWEYSSWIIKMVEYDGNWYMGWLTGEGEEYGDLADLKADKYLILPKHD